MSRIGKLPVSVPAGVTITVSEGNLVKVKGPKGELQQQISPDMIIKVEGDTLLVERPSEAKHHKALHGLSRTLINNMVVGVTEGYTKALDVVGVGYRVQMQGKKLVLNVGYSHPVEFDEIAGITYECPSANKIIVSGIDKQLVGQIAANIRITRKPEPYKGKGIRYENEYVRRKVGKAAK